MAKRRSKLELVYDEFENLGNVKTQKCTPSPKSFSPLSLVSIKAQTEPQAEFLEAFYNQVPVIFQAGSAGVGKSFFSIYAALTEIYHKDSPYDKLVLVRSAVQTRQIGFLKGTEEEKNESYEAIYEGMFDDMHVYKSNNYKNLKELGKLEFHNTSFLRGRTFDHSIIVVDESSNLSYHELYTIMTRLGKFSKIVFCGDYKQSDLKGSEKNGFNEFLEVINHMPKEMAKVIYYRPEHILRSDVVKEFIIADEKVSDLKKIREKSK